MGSLPALSILKGPQRSLTNGKEPLTLHRIFENTVLTLEKINQNNNNNEVKTIHSIHIKESVAQSIALISENEKICFLDLNKSANKLARAIIKNIGLHKQKNSDGDVLIAVCIKPSIALVTTLLAIWKAGAAYLPLDMAFPKNRIKHILDESEPVMTIVDDFVIDDSYNIMKYSELKEQSNALLETDVSEVETLTKDIPKTKLLAAVLYTSGSTGIPKGVRILHSAILNRLKWQWRTFPYSATEKVCVFKTALTFVDSVCELWGPLLNARSVVIISKEDTKNPEILTNILEKYQVERLILVPTLLQTILLYASMKKSETFLPNLRLFVCSGETLTMSLVEQFFNYFKDKVICNFYGSTEIMGDVTYHVIRSKEEIYNEEKVPIGVPLDNCTVYILNKDQEPVNYNEVGELFVSGLNLAAGYVRNRDPDKFVNNELTVDPGHAKLYRTGDFAKIVKNTIYYEGRTDSQIKVRGHRVDLSEIESAVAKMEEVDKCVVLTYKPGDVNQAVLSFVTLKIKITEKEIEEHLKLVLASYMLPQVIIVDHFPLLVNGKVDRQYLLRKYQEEYSPENNSGSNKLGESIIDYTGIPVEKMEKAKDLFETISSVLGKSLRSYINKSSNFYSLGGNSLNSVYTLTKLHDLGYCLSISEFVSSPTLLELINKMEKNKQINENKLSENENYRSELLKEKYKKDIIEIITSSFYEKADLERHLVPTVPMSDYLELMEVMWPHLLDKNLSFAVMDNTGHIVGAALNFDAHDEPEVSISEKNRLNVVFEFLEFLEEPIRTQKLPNGKNKILHSFMMGSRTDLTPQETVEVFFFMEKEVLNLARNRNFEGVFTSNTNALTQQLGCDVNNYESLLNYQPNQYVASDGSKPFASAPDSQKTIVSWRKV